LTNLSTYHLFPSSSAITTNYEAPYYVIFPVLQLLALSNIPMFFPASFYYHFHSLIFP